MEDPKTIAFSGTHSVHARENCTQYFCQLVVNFCKWHNLSISFHVTPKCFGDFCLTFGEYDENYFPISIFEIAYVNVMVPVSMKKDKSDYFVRPFDKTVWIFLFFGIFYASLSISFVQNMQKRYMDFGKNLLNCFRITISSVVNLKNLMDIEKIINGFLIINGLFLGICFNLHFGNYLIVDLNENDFQIKCLPNHFKMFKNHKFKSDLQLKIKESTDFEVISELSNLNTEYGYCVGDTFWKKRLGFQKMYKKNLYRLVLPKWEAGDYFGLVMSKGFPHKDLFNYFTVKVFSGGLMAKWETEMWEENHIQKLQSSTRSRTNRLLSLNDFRFFFGIFLICSMLGGVVFIGEMLHYKFYSK